MCKTQYVILREKEICMTKFNIQKPPRVFQQPDGSRVEQYMDGNRVTKEVTYKDVNGDGYYDYKTLLGTDLNGAQYFAPELQEDINSLKKRLVGGSQLEAALMLRSMDYVMSDSKNKFIPMGLPKQEK